MDKTKITKNKQKKDLMISIKISKNIREWLDENKYSPSGIFNEAIKDLGFVEDL